MTVIQLQARLQSPQDLGRAARALWPVTPRERTRAQMPRSRPLLARADTVLATITRAPWNPPRAAHLLQRGATVNTAALKSFLPSFLRTVVPLIVGALISVPAVAAFGITTEQLTTVVTVLITGLYWLAVRGLEQLHPQFGWLLGYAAQPVYPPASEAGATASPAGDVARVMRS